MYKLKFPGDKSEVQESDVYNTADTSDMNMCVACLCGLGLKRMQVRCDGVINYPGMTD